MKIRPEGADLSHTNGRIDGWTEGQTDMSQLIVAFRNFAKAPKIVYIQYDNKMKRMNKIWGQNIVCFNVKPDGTNRN